MSRAVIFSSGQSLVFTAATPCDDRANFRKKYMKKLFSIEQTVQSISPGDPTIVNPDDVAASHPEQYISLRQWEDVKRIFSPLDTHTHAAAVCRTLWAYLICYGILSGPLCQHRTGERAGLRLRAAQFIRARLTPDCRLRCTSSSWCKSAHRTQNQHSGAEHVQRSKKGGRVEVRKMRCRADRHERMFDYIRKENKR